MSENRDSRELLIQAAKRAFGDRGFEGATVKEIAEAAGVNISLVSYYFGGKEGLYKTILEQFGLNRLAAAERILKPGASAEEFRIRLKMFMEEFIDQHFSDPDFAKIMHRDCTFDNPVTQEVFKSTFVKVFGTLVQFFEEARRLKIMREDMPALMTAGNFFGAMIHRLRTDDLAAMQFGVTLKDPKHREEYIHHAILMLTEGVFRNQIWGPA